MKNYELKRLRTLHGKLYEKKIYYREKFELSRERGIPHQKKVYLLGTPTHTNLGDSAIALAQKELLKAAGILSKDIKEITLNEYRNHAKLCRKLISKKSLITQLGGGNMGDIWFDEEVFRRQVIEDFRENPMVIFPQTIHYSETEKGIFEGKHSVKFYDNHSKLTLYAREQQSYEIMKHCNRFIFFPRNNNNIDIFLNSSPMYLESEISQKDYFNSPIEEIMYESLLPLIKKYGYTLKREYTVRDTGRTEIRYALDLAVLKGEDLVLDIETDGLSFHKDYYSMAADRQRDRWLLMRGVPTLRFTSREVFDDLENSLIQIEEVLSVIKKWKG